MPSAFSVNVPYVPTRPVPTVPPAIADTVFVSPASTSVSLLKTLPVALLPAAVPASTATPTSATATGPSLLPWIVITRFVVLVKPAVSRIVYANVSVSVFAAVLNALTVALALFTA